jgi:hypothetical protein
MRYTEIERLFQVELSDNWTATDQLVFDNLSAPTGNVPWARFYIQPTFSENMTLGIGSQRINREGLATMDVFVPTSSGTRVAADIADEFLELLENQQLGERLFTYSGVANRIGDAANGWYLINVTIDFQAT